MTSTTHARRLPALLLSLSLLLPVAAPAFAFGVPALLKDIKVGAASSSPASFLRIGGKLVFFADDGASGIEPWVSDGTPGGTFLLRDVWPGASGSFNPSCAVCNAVAVGNTVFFIANDGSGLSTLWKTDGTTAGTVNVAPGVGASSVGKVGSIVFFAGQYGLVWKSDGTAAGTVMVSGTYMLGSEIAEMNGVAYYPGADNFSGYELWKSDGTEAGTVRVKDLNPGSPDGLPSLLTNIGGTLYFSASNGTAAGFYKSDGTAAGTVLVKQVGMQGFAGLDRRQIVSLNGTIYLIASDPAHGFELWKSDGTTAGTVMVKDIYPGVGAGLAGSALVVAGNTLFFKAGDDTHGYELWKSDGTAAGTVMVKDIFPSISGSIPADLADVNGTLFFSAMSSYAAGTQPWTSDGTEAGTVQLASVYPANNSAPKSFTAVGANIFFSANNGTNGVELWSMLGGTLDAGPGAPLTHPTIALAQNEPNPVRSTTRIAWTLPSDERVVLRLFDASGRLARTLLDGDQSAGAHQLELDAKGLRGGVYFYQLQTGSQLHQRKMVVLPR